MTQTQSGFISGLLVMVWLIAAPGQVLGGDLVDLIPGLYGGDGITLATTGGSIEHAPHFNVESAASINLLNTQIGSEIAVFPFSSSGGGFTFAFDPKSGTFVRSTESLGPLFAERAPTLGRNKLNLQFAYTFFKYSKFEGNHLDNLQVVARHESDVIGPAQGGSDTEREDFELDVIPITFDIDIHVSIFSFAATYGLTDRLDLGILVPVVRIDMDVSADATIVQSPSNSEPGIHTFEGGPESPHDEASGKAFGLGDIVLRAKYHLLTSDIADIAGALLVKLATGNEDDFLGSGDTTIRPFFVLSKTYLKRFTPHINVGYEFNLNDSNRSALEYVTGFDLSLFRDFDVLADVIGSYEPNGDGIGDNIVNLSLGIRWNLFARFILSANVQLPLNDQGLRADVIPTLAAEYTF